MSNGWAFCTYPSRIEFADPQLSSLWRYSAQTSLGETMTDDINPRLERYLADDRLTLEHKALLAQARQSLADAGFYAYGMLNEPQQWVVAIDDEQGQADIRLEDDMFVIEIRGVSPGLFSEEESEWRRRALERLARR